jgi:hypothetical protein
LELQRRRVVWTLAGKSAILKKKTVIKNDTNRFI